MSLKEYEVMTEGRHPHKTTMLLNEADAKRFGVFGNDKLAKAPAAKAAKAPANKASKPAPNKAVGAPVAAENTPPVTPGGTPPATGAAE